MALTVIKKLAASMLRKSKGYGNGNGHMPYRQYVGTVI